MKPIYGSENYFFVACTWPLILDSKSFFPTSALFKEPGVKTWDVFQLLSFVHNHHKPIQANKLNAKTQLFLLLWQTERGWCTDAELKYHRRKNNSLSFIVSQLLNHRFSNISLDRSIWIVKSLRSQTSHMYLGPSSAAFATLRPNLLVS